TAWLDRERDRGKPLTIKKLLQDFDLALGLGGVIFRGGKIVGGQGLLRCLHVAVHQVARTGELRAEVHAHRLLRTFEGAETALDSAGANSELRKVLAKFQDLGAAGARGSRGRGRRRRRHGRGLLLRLGLLLQLLLGLLQRLRGNLRPRRGRSGTVVRRRVIDRHLIGGRGRRSGRRSL